MPNSVLIDEFPVTFLVPRGIAAVRVRGIRRTLLRSPFRRRLEILVRAMVRRYSTLDGVTLTVSR